MSIRLLFAITLTCLLIGCSKDQVKEDGPAEVTDLRMIHKVHYQFV